MHTEDQALCDGALFVTMHMKLVCKFVAKKGANYGIPETVIDAAQICGAGEFIF